jgi:hypothetical protein
VAASENGDETQQLWARGGGSEVGPVALVPSPVVAARSPEVTRDASPSYALCWVGRSQGRRRCLRSFRRRWSSSSGGPQVRHSNGGPHALEPVARAESHSRRQQTRCPWNRGRAIGADRLGSFLRPDLEGDYSASPTLEGLRLLPGRRQRARRPSSGVSYCATIGSVRITRTLKPSMCSGRRRA